MLLVGSKPLIQWSVEMHILSGFRELAIILHPEKNQIREYIENGVTRGPGGELFRAPGYFRGMLRRASIRFYYQRERTGVVSAALLASDFVAGEPFALVMPDCLLFSREPFLAKHSITLRPKPDGTIGFLMLEKGRAVQFGNVGLLTVRHEKGPLYRIDELSDKGQGKVSFREPLRAKGFAGGIYAPDYFDYARTTRPSESGELDDVPIHQAMARKGGLFGVKLDGAAFDAGNPAGFYAANRYAGGARSF